MSKAREWFEKHAAGPGWHERSRGGGNGGSSSGGGIGGKIPGAAQFGLAGIVLIVVLLAWALYSVFYTVQPEERAVIKRFDNLIVISSP